MGLFFSSDRFTRPGPGVRPDAPRKKGVARLAEIMGRDMWNFFRAGFLAFLGCLPFIIGMFFAVETHALLFMLLAGIIGGLIAGPELSAMADTVLRSLRDEPGYWWETYRRVWKRNARESLIPGMLTGLVLSMQIFTLFHMSVISAGIVTWVLLILSFVVTLGLESYIWPQIALLDLPLYGILKNSLLLFLGYLPRSLGAIAIKAVYWGAILLFFPLTTIILPFTNFWLPMLPALLCIYQPPSPKITSPCPKTPPRKPKNPPKLPPTTLPPTSSNPFTKRYKKAHSARSIGAVRFFLSLLISNYLM